MTDGQRAALLALLRAAAGQVDQLLAGGTCGQPAAKPAPAMGKPVRLLPARAAPAPVAVSVPVPAPVPPARLRERMRAAAKVGNAPPTTPKCPKCGQPMIERHNGRTGDPFWGCRGYPACRGSRPSARGLAAENARSHRGRRDDNDFEDAGPDEGDGWED